MPAVRPPLLLIITAIMGNFLGFAGLLWNSCLGFWGRVQDGAEGIDVPLVIRICIWVQLVLSLVLVLAMQGLFRLSPSSRRLSLWWAVANLVNQGTSATAYYFWSPPQTHSSLWDQFILIAIWIGFSVFLLVVLSLPRIAQAFRGAPS